MGSEQLDETALNCLLLDDQVEPATAYAASIIDSEPQPATRSNRRYFDLGLACGAILYALYWLL